MELICYTVMGVFPALVILSMVSVYHSGVCHQSFGVIISSSKHTDDISFLPAGTVGAVRAVAWRRLLLSGDYLF